MTVKRRNLPADYAETNGHAHQNGSVVTAKRSVKAQRPVDEENDSWTTSNILKIYLPMFGFIFGGCCSNVYALEALVNTYPSSGNIITALQFLLTSLITLPDNVDLRRPTSWKNAFLRERKIPLRSWAIYTAMFLACNVLNNTALSYRISVPLHIILRSAGPVTTMLTYYFVSGKKYPPLKILAVLILFIGVMISAASDCYSKAPKAFEPALSTAETEPSSSRFSIASLLTASDTLREQAPGFALLATALILAALLGLYSDKLYATYGRSSAITSESLFYSHALSLPYFAMQLPQLKRSFVILMQNSEPLSVTLASSKSQLPLLSLLDAIPAAVPMLLLNAVTQYICISGVNRLSAKSSSLTVSIVLNIRKLFSLLLSIWLFGNRLPVGVVVGAGLVFLGGGLYAVPNSAGDRKAKADGVAKINGLVKENGTTLKKQQ